MNQLIVLPCNGGAKAGDYLIPDNPQLGVLWKKFYGRFATRCKFGAIDSIISFLHDDGLGAIVLYPEEMHRVMGYDILTTFEACNPTRPAGLKKLIQHTECLKTSIDRIFPNFDRILVCLNLEVYKMCMYSAITEKNQWHKVLFYDQLAAQFQYHKIRDEVERDLENPNLVGIKRVPAKPIEQKWIDKWTKYRAVVPERWRYWEPQEGIPIV